MLLSQNALNIVIREIRARVTRACIHGDKVEICIDYGHYLHHDARIIHDFSNFAKINNKKSKALIEK